jgi:hypothetical protein
LSALVIGRRAAVSWLLDRTLRDLAVADVSLRTVVPAQNLDVLGLAR